MGERWREGSVVKGERWGDGEGRGHILTRREREEEGLYIC